MRELVVFFYQWKKSTRYQPVYSTYCLKNRPGKIVKTLHHLSSQTPMLGLDSLPPPCLTSSSFQHHQSTFSSSEPTPIVLLDQVCSNCQITLKQVVSSATKKLLAKKIPKQRPDVFYPRPFIFSSNLNSKSAALCYDCHVHWFKYGAMQHIPQSVKRQREEEAALVAAAAISPEKVTVAGRKYSGRGGRSRGGKGRGKKSSSKATTRKYRYDDSEEEDSNESDEDEDTPPPPPPPCSVCRSAEFFESNPMVCCLECGLYVHQSCYGLSSSTTKASQASFVCDRCFNDNSPVANINYHCILCPAEHSATRGAMKKTIGNNWVHVQCAIWVPEVQFGNAERFESVECTGLIKSLRFDEVRKKELEYSMTAPHSHPFFQLGLLHLLKERERGLC